jgi:hypothetical protein
MNLKYRLKITFVLFLFALSLGAFSQELKRLTLEQVLDVAREQSPQAIAAKHSFLGSYWEFRTFKARYRPRLSLDANLLDFNRALEQRYNSSTGEDYYVEINTNNANVGMDLRQNIGFTGGAIFATSSFRAFSNQVFTPEETTQFITVPISVGFSQPILQYNALKWEKKVEPIKYEEAKKNYLDDMEFVNGRAVNLFFNLALAQLNVEIANFNYSNSDTLYRIAQGRFNIGTIAEDELLQMQLSFLNAGTALNQSQIDLQIQEFQLRSFLGYNENVRLELIIPREIPELEVNVAEALALAHENNPEIQTLERQLIEADQGVAIAKGEKGLSADLFMSFGYTGSGTNPPVSYQDLLDEQRVRLGLQLPIVDWGLGRGRLKMAESNRNLIRTNVLQAQIDFDQSVMLSVAQFNLQDDQLTIAATADTIAQKRYEVTKQRFLIGKIDVLDLNVADSEKDVARRNYITALRNYWSDFYGVRRLTLFDFIRDERLDAHFEAMVE